MIAAALGLLFLLIFSELASANFKRLAPVIEAWDHNKTLAKQAMEIPNMVQGGWGKLAVLFWAIGTSIPLLAFTLACNLFLTDDRRTSDLIVGTAIGNNIIGLSLAFGLIMMSGPITFFRIRTMTSPVFLLLGTMAFTFACLNNVITRWEAGFLLLLVVAYGFYFRRFSSEWKHYERQQVTSTLLESADGLLPILAVFCMGIGFFILAVLVSYPFLVHINQTLEQGRILDSKLAIHGIAFFLSLPWLFRSVYSVKESATEKALTLTSISHACLLNMLFIPGITALFHPLTLSMRMVSMDLPVLLLLTGVFVCSLLVEKEEGGCLTLLLIASYFLYTGLGLFL